MAVLTWLLLVTVFIVVVSGGIHTNNWAVIVGTSRYWFNYRHNANALAVYHTVKSLGIPDSQIILMLSDDFACNGRNAWKASMTAGLGQGQGVYDTSIEVDYRGLECNVENFLKVLTHRTEEDELESRRLDTDEQSNILIYMSGHGGDTFLKFHDKQEIQSGDFAEAFEMMRLQKRFHRILFLTDTCQASTLASQIRTVDVTSLGSSSKDESSYSYSSDPSLGVTIVDRFTRELVLYFFEHSHSIAKRTLNELMKSVNRFEKLHAHAVLDYGPNSIDDTTHSGVGGHSEPKGPQTRLIDFFGAHTDVLLWNDTVTLNNEKQSISSLSSSSSIRKGGVIRMSESTRNLFDGL